jgi:ABC-type uncharacterized transport system permease subunit
MVRYATPLRSPHSAACSPGQVINIALEGIMLVGAFTASAVEGRQSVDRLICAAVAGLLVALIHAVASIQFRPIRCGGCNTILFLGVPPLVSGAF